MVEAVLEEVAGEGGGHRALGHTVLLNLHEGGGAQGGSRGEGEGAQHFGDGEGPWASFCHRGRQQHCLGTDHMTDHRAQIDQLKN